MQFVQVVNGTQDDLYTVESYLRTFLASDQGNAPTDEPPRISIQDKPLK